ncbi:PREDICTED: uncharacterized protein LOC100640403 [Amphimedon queenslandica]|uniref:MARVEL domain-containing protein n=1 Tax=Amphimedon queenslandica TaxID=400682 RepID=A0A1X7VFB5_AMPQE|nr:PREDICTED: uncharacterized protein LOC100640403 [Amphimedon queenslandica]|eukprot:XP_003384387.1 PREDICTED: uncharacterized protein LOC100640403 [Amphimedon queenslandica]
MRKSRADEDDWLLDGGERRRRERNWTVTFCSFFFCLLYLVALAMALGSVGYFGMVQYHVSKWNESESKNRPCILYSKYNKGRNALNVGDNVYCILNIGGDVILALLCLLLLAISLFQLTCGIWNTCSAICTLLLQILALILGLLLAINLLSGYYDTCRNTDKRCAEYFPKDNDDGYIRMSQGAVLVCFFALFASLAMQILLLCCCRKRTHSTSQELGGNEWIDSDRIMKREKYNVFD